MAVNDTWECITEYQVGPSVAWNVTHWGERAVHSDPDPAKIDQALTLAAAVQGRFVNDILPNLSADTLSVVTTAQKIQGGGVKGPVMGSFIASGTAGGVSIDSHAEFTAIVVEKYSDAPVLKPLRGRMYIAGMPQTFSDGGVLISSFLADYQTAVEAFFADLGPLAGGAEYVAGIWGPTNGAFGAIQALIVNPVLGTQRRRRRRRLATASGEGPSA